MSTSTTELPALEIWEIQIPGRVSVSVRGEYGKPRTISAKGKGQRLRLSTHDRLIAQEVIRHEQNDPFKNGMLVHVNRADGALVDSTQEVTDEDLKETFVLLDEDFDAAIRGLSEVNVRRLQTFAREDGNLAKASQVTTLEEYIAQTWPIGGDTPTYREMNADPAGR